MKTPEYSSPCVICAERVSREYECREYCWNYARWLMKNKGSLKKIEDEEGEKDNDRDVK